MNNLRVLYIHIFVVKLFYWKKVMEYQNVSLNDVGSRLLHNQDIAFSVYYNKFN